jgi:Ca-activated chloride channel family protein
VWAWKVRQKLLASFVQARLLPGLLAGVSPARVKIRAALLCLALVFLIVALARPQWGFRWEEVKMRGLDIVVAIDTSRSMLAEDIVPNRLARAKLAALDLVQQAKTDRLGLIAFAGSAFLQCPLTTDDAAFRQCVESLDVRTIPDGGTALAEAIKTASTAFQEGDNYKVLVLFSDGEDQDQGAVEAAREAAKAGLRIFTIGFGKPEGELLRIQQPNGTTDYIRDEEGNVVKSRLNEDLLREIASATEGGFYLPMQGAKPIETLYEKGLAPLPKSESGERLVKRYFERYHWPLAVAIALILAEFLLPERKREPRPAATAGIGGRGREAPVSVGGISTPPTTRSSGSPPPIPASAAGLLLCLVLPWSSLASNSGALREYKAGNYEKAQQEFERLLQKNQDDLRYQFNAGAAAYKNQQYNQAAEHFSKALNSSDIKLQEKAYFNRGNTLFHLGENTPEPQKKIETWEKSLKDYDATTKLNPQDADAKHNAELVKRLLEELKQQQQQQQQQDQNKDDQQQKQDQQQDQQPQNNQQQQQDQKQDQQSQQNQDQQKDQQQGQQQQQQQQQQQNQEQQQKDSQQSGQKDKSDQQKESQKSQAASGEPGDKDQQQKQEEAYAPGQMTPQQAKQLLDAQKGDEKMLPVRPVKPADPSRRLRDW